MSSKIVKYKVIADFPASMNEIGDIISVYESTGMAYVVEIDDTSEKYDIRDYPHLYEKLPEQD